MATTHKQECTEMKAWPLASTNTHIFCAAPQKRFCSIKSVHGNTAAMASMLADERKIQMKGDQMLATPCKCVAVVPSLPLLHLRSLGPNVHSSWHMAMASIWGMRSQRSRGRWSSLMGWPVGYECYLTWLLKPPKWKSFMLTLGWIRWGIWGRPSALKWNSK